LTIANKKKEGKNGTYHPPVSAGVLTLQLSDAARVERECLIDKLKSLLSKR